MRTFRGGLLIGLAVAVLVAAAAITYERYDTRTLKRTVRRGEVLCGVNKGLPGFSSPDDKGNWTGFDVDFCRAVAAAIFDDPGKAKFVPLDASERFKELQNRKVDILSRNSTWSMSRETELRPVFPGGHLLRRPGLHAAARAQHRHPRSTSTTRKVCVQSGTTTELNLADYFRANNMKYEEVKFAKLDDVVKAYDAGQCDTLTADVSQLYALRLNLAKPDDHVILPDVISKEPLAPVVRQRDDDWMMIVKWTLYAMINAEELGVTSQNIDEALKSEEAGRDAAGRHRRQLTASSSASPRTGPSASSATSAITARSTSAMSAPNRKLEDPARNEPALERRRHPVRPADQVRASAQDAPIEFATRPNCHHPRKRVTSTPRHLGLSHSRRGVLARSTVRSVVGRRRR